MANTLFVFFPFSPSPSMGEGTERLRPIASRQLPIVRGPAQEGVEFCGFAAEWLNKNLTRFQTKNAENQSD
jgi:hypothetical protein